MDISIKVANFWAKLSCPRWNKIRPLRHFARKKYRNLAKGCWESAWWACKTDKYQKGSWGINTYPMPYAHPYFASWEEDDSEKGYNLISDQSGCVIKYSTSYCAWKIFEAAGVWPQKTSEQRLDAKNWVQFLDEAGYDVVTEDLDPDFHYVGINPNLGEWGLVVWLEEVSDETAIVSTYVDKEYCFFEVEKNEYSWVKICHRKYDFSGA